MSTPVIRAAWAPEGAYDVTGYAQLCDAQADTDGTVRVLDREAVLQAATDLAGRGLRVLATVVRSVTGPDDSQEGGLAAPDRNGAKARFCQCANTKSDRPRVVSLPPLRRRAHLMLRAADQGWMFSRSSSRLGRFGSQPSACRV